MVHRRRSLLKSPVVTPRKARSSGWLCYLMVVPMGLAVRIPIDSTEASPDTLDAPITVASPAWRSTKLTLGGGTGRYYREVLFPYATECGTSNRMVPFEQDFNDAGAELDFQTSRVGHAGIRGGYIFGDATLAGEVDTLITDPEGPEQLDTIYFNPYFSFEWDYVGLGVGALVSTHKLQMGDAEDYPIDDDPSIYPTAHFRFGDLSRLYISGNFWEGVPIYSGGGKLVGGIGLRPVRPLELYAGYCATGPYQEEAWLGRLTLDVNRSWALMTTLRFPVGYDAQEDEEYAVSVGLSYRWYRR